MYGVAKEVTRTGNWMLILTSTPGLKALGCRMCTWYKDVVQTISGENTFKNIVHLLIFWGRAEYTPRKETFYGVVGLEPAILWL